MSKYGSAVVNQQLRYVSASAITAFDPSQFGGCNRKWWWEKIAGKKPLETKSQTLGKKVHKEIEHYLKTGEKTIGEIVLPGFRFLPKPGKDLCIEEEFCDFEKALVFRDKVLNGLNNNVNLYALAPLNIPVMGQMDVRHRRGEWVDNNGVIRKEALFYETAEIGDWKTTTDILQWAKDEEGLINTIQMPLYAKATTWCWPDIQFVRISHGYFGTKKREAKKVSVLLDREIIEKRWIHVQKTVGEMVEVAKEVDFLKVLPNLESCSAYQGCPHASYCTRPNRGIVDLLGGQGEMSTLFDLVKSESNGETKIPSLPLSDLERRTTIDFEKAKLLAEDAGPPPLPKYDSILPPDVPKTDLLTAAKPLPSAVSAKIEDPELKAKVEAHAKAHAEKKISEAKASTGKCPSGGVIARLSMDQLASKKMTCSACSKELRLKPEKNEQGEWIAKLPGHIMVKPSLSPEAIVEEFPFANDNLANYLAPDVVLGQGILPGIVNCQNTVPDKLTLQIELIRDSGDSFKIEDLRFVIK